MEIFYLRGVSLPFPPDLPNYEKDNARCMESIQEGNGHIGPIRQNKSSDIMYCACCQARVNDSYTNLK